MTLSFKELASQLEAAKTKNKELDNQNEKLLANKTEILKKIEVLRQAESNEESKDSKTFILNDKQQKKELEEEMAKIKNIQDKINILKESNEAGNQNKNNIHALRLTNEKLKYAIQFLKDNPDFCEMRKNQIFENEEKENSTKSKILSLRKSNAILENQIESLKQKKKQMEEFMYSQYEDDEKKE